MNHIIYCSRDHLFRLKIDKIVYFEADGNYTKVVMANKLKSVPTLSLSNVEKSLTSQLGDDAAKFIRVGKRFIINRTFIYEVNLVKQCLILSDCSQFAFQLPVSKAALKSIKDLVANVKE